MNCDEAERQLYAWLDGELDAERARNLGDHLRQCPACAGEADAIRRLYAAAGAILPFLPLPPGFAAATVRAAMQKAQPQPADLREWWQHLSWSWRWAASAVAVAGLMLGMVSYQLAVSPGDSLATPAEARFLGNDGSLSASYARVVWAKGDEP